MIKLMKFWMVPGTTLGQDYKAYCNPCYRVFNFSLALCEAENDEILQKVAIAVAFHDLGLWTVKIFDYLEPSRQLLRDYLAKENLSGWTAEIQTMIERHHKLNAYSNNSTCWWNHSGKRTGLMSR